MENIAYLISFNTSKAWINLLEFFREELESVLGSELIRLVALPSSNSLVYESNVLVVVREASLKTISKVSEAALKAQMKAGVTGLNPLTISESEEWIKKAFEGAEEIELGKDKGFD